MALIVDWSNTKEALSEFMKLLNCTHCNQLLKDACSFELCDHYFCKVCAMDLVNSSKPCPSCNAVLWREHLQESFKIPEVLSICKKLHNLIYDKDDEINTEEIPRQSEAITDVNTYVFDSVPPEKPDTYEDTEDLHAYEERSVDSLNNQNDHLDREKHHFTALKGHTENRESTKNHGIAKVLTIDVDTETNNEGCQISPLESPPISSQFSNIITKSEIKKGVQRNPRRMIKPPKVTYTRHKKPLSYSSEEEVGDDTDSKDKEVVTVEEEPRPRKLTRQRKSVEILEMDDTSDKSKENVNKEMKLKKVTRAHQRKSVDFLVEDERDKDEEQKPADEVTRSKKVTRARQRNSVEICENETKDQDETGELFQKEKRTSKKKNSRSRQRKSVAFQVEATTDKNVDDDENVAKESSSKKTSCNLRKRSVEIIEDSNREKSVLIIEESKQNKSSRTRERSSVESEKEMEIQDKEKEDKRPKPVFETAAKNDDKYSIFDFPIEPSGKESTEGGNYDNHTLHEITKRKKAKNSNVERKRKRKSSTEQPIKDKNPEIPKSKRLSVDEKAVKAKKAVLEKKNKKGETPLHAACIKGNVEKVKDLLEQGAQANTKDHAGWTPLHEASNLGFTEIVALLLDYGAIIDVVAGEDNDTPLHDAVSNNRIEVVKLLLDRSAPTNVRNRLGLLPIDYAAKEEIRELFERTTEQSNTSVLDESRFDESNMEEEKVLVTTNIKNSEKSLIEKCCTNLGGRLVRDFDTKVTHLICGTTEDEISISRTLKYWYGILHGKWLVSYKWVEDSIREKKWLREVDYEVKGTIEAPYGIPRKARINNLKMLPKLFDGCSFYLAGAYKTLAKDVVADLIKLGGGKILSREPKTSDVDPLLAPITSATTKLDILPTRIQPTVIFHAKDTSSQTCCTQYIIYDEKSEPAYTRIFSPVLCSTTVSWLLDCISNFEILDIKEDHYSEDIHSSQS